MYLTRAASLSTYTFWHRQRTGSLPASPRRGCLRSSSPRPARAVRITVMELKAIRVEVPENGNVIIGHSHFIKTVEDLYEAIVNTAPQMKFGIAFNEASGACLTRVDGNDADLQANATRNAQAVAAGHSFVIAMRDGFPINEPDPNREIPEICTIYCATANPVEVILAETGQGRGILGVIDGSPPQGVEGEADREWRHGLLRKIGYKR